MEFTLRGGKITWSHVNVYTICDMHLQIYYQLMDIRTFTNETQRTKEQDRMDSWTAKSMQ